MKRREFISSWAARRLHGRSGAGAAGDASDRISPQRVGSRRDEPVTAFRQGLKEAGFVEGQNVMIEFRSADNQLDRLPALVAEFDSPAGGRDRRQPISALAAKAATTTVPIVFATGSDPVKDGLVASLNRPGGNVTGVNFLGGALGAKRLELLRQLVPKATTIGVLVNPNRVDTEAERRDVQAAAQAIGQQLSFSMPAATAISRRPLQRSSSAGLARCSSVPARS